MKCTLCRSISKCKHSYRIESLQQSLGFERTTNRIIKIHASNPSQSNEAMIQRGRGILCKYHCRLLDDESDDSKNNSFDESSSRNSLLNVESINPIWSLESGMNRNAERRNESYFLKMVAKRQKGYLMFWRHEGVILLYSQYLGKNTKNVLRHSRNILYQLDVQ